MKSINVNGVNFRGQFANAYELLEKGHTINMGNFNNGSFEPTTKVKRFLMLIEKAGVKSEITGESLRSTKIKMIK